MCYPWMPLRDARVVLFVSAAANQPPKAGPRPSSVFVFPEFISEVSIFK